MSRVDGTNPTSIPRTYFYHGTIGTTGSHTISLPFTPRYVICRSNAGSYPPNASTALDFTGIYNITDGTIAYRSYMIYDGGGGAFPAANLLAESGSNSMWLIVDNAGVTQITFTALTVGTNTFTYTATVGASWSTLALVWEFRE